MPADPSQEHLYSVSPSVRLPTCARCHYIPTMNTSVWSFVCLFFCFHVNSQKKYPVTFEDALLQRFTPESFNGTWISSNEYIYEDENVVLIYNVKTDKSSTLLNRTLFEKFKLTDVLVSADGRWLSVAHDEKSIFRHSTTSLYTLINLETGDEYSLAGRKRVQLLVWAPVGAGLAFVMDNNVYYQSESERQKDTYRQITNSTKDVYNGVADWVYEEEVLEDSKALWFSPNGTKLVFATMNDTNVRNVTFWKYGDPRKLDSQYVQEIVIKYPKVGTRNPVAYLNYVDLTSEHLIPTKFNAPEHLVTSDNILGPVAWANETHFSVTWLERLQTRAYTLLCGDKEEQDVPSNCQVVYSYLENNGWLDIKQAVWLNSSAFVTVLPQDQGGDNGNYRQLSLVTNNRSVALTSGLDVVTDINCYDRGNNIIYFTSTVGGDSAKKLVYKMKLSSPYKKECFSCIVQQNCSFGIASFSHSCANAVLTCKGSSVPQFHIYNKEGELLHPMSYNMALRDVLSFIELPTQRDLTVPVGDGFTARVRLLLPPNMDQTGRKKYPVLFNVYSGPDTNKISDSWETPGWDEYLCTRRGIIIVYVAGRGSGLRGDKLKFSIYHRLGGPEVDDILIVGKYIQEKFPWVDQLRTSVWGWSYGGFATAMALAKDTSNIFRCGISVAPVTNWIYYDTVYTERFMGLPTNDSNWAGYQASDVSSRVQNFRHKLFYLIHGNADDNVHYQQSMMLSRALELSDILFFQQSYPDETHSLSRVRRHLYHSMDKFWTRCFHLNASDFMDPGLPSSDLDSVEYSYE